MAGEYGYRNVWHPTPELNFEQAEALLKTARDPEAGKLLCNNTRLFKRTAPNGAYWYAIQLHSTDVVTIERDGSFGLFTGGYYTMTTKDRIIRFSPANPWSEQEEWWLGDEPFFEGMTVNSQGEVIGWPTLATVAGDQSPEGKLITQLFRKYLWRWHEAQANKKLHKIAKHYDQFIPDLNLLIQEDPQKNLLRYGAASRGYSQGMIDRLMDWSFRPRTSRKREQYWALHEKLMTVGFIRCFDKMVGTAKETSLVDRMELHGTLQKLAVERRTKKRLTFL